ncbi:radical SAM family heme chaperone HemW [Anaerotignum sp.]|nr:radical SAM family heme chaperone HemW [Anaerotignum sp.]MBQ7758579.1 oxygen-independent coproporphyrinogen III oxidase [Anaerotignum sp.]
MNTVGLYIHIPFCRQKCLYCDFPSWAGKESLMQAYVDALTAEIKARGKEYPNKKVVSVFFGGGTPTTLEIPLLEQLMQAVFASWDIAEDAEITTEANPGTLDREMATALKKMGFNRLSMGVQAWQNRLLKDLGRIHTIEGFLENYKAVREAGFENVNVDLMFALPNQTMADWQETVKNITALEPEHISAYSLIIEEGTPFFERYEKGQLEPASEELDRKMYHWAVDYLAEKGYEQYEISNFAKKGKQSRHNRIYWQAEEYLGMGLGSHSYMEGERFHNIYDLQEYIAANGDVSLLKEDIEIITEEDALAEFMFLGLRLTEGVSFARFRERFGKEMQEVYGGQMKELKQEGLLEENAEGIRLTRRGIDVSNVAFEKFLL